MTEQITIKNLDHLGLIAGIIDEIDIENIVNSLIKTDQREKISAGTIVKAIILNGLGYLSKPLYLFPEFFRDKPVEKLLGNGIKAEEINDDKIGRVMNELYQVSGDKLWTQIGLNMIKLFEINLTKKKWKYHKLTEIKCQDKMEKYELKYEENKEIIELEKTKCGRFILATKIMDNKELVGEEMLCQYKNQQSCERGFRFLKDPLLLTKSVEVMGMLMGLCLLVYNIGQRMIRKELKRKGEKIRNQRQKPIDNPTLSWIFQLFQGIHLVQLEGKEMVSNLTEEIRKILGYFSKKFQKYYSY